ncbi:MAG: transposase [Cyanobacteria bacterium J06592_8]
MFLVKPLKLSKNIELEICHYFVNLTTSGAMEGLNNKIKLILRQSYGFKSFEMMREKLLANSYFPFDLTTNL